MKLNAVCHTNGCGLWSNTAKPVTIERMDLDDYSDDFAELRVYFDISTWNLNDDGLIYTDPQFLKDLKLALHHAGFSGKACQEIDYSEQGMQGRNYVSCDVSGKNFIKEYYQFCEQAAMLAELSVNARS